MSTLSGRGVGAHRLPAYTPVRRAAMQGMPNLYRRRHERPGNRTVEVTAHRVVPTSARPGTPSHLRLCGHPRVIASRGLYGLQVYDRTVSAFRDVEDWCW